MTCWDCSDHLQPIAPIQRQLQAAAPIRDWGGIFNDGGTLEIAGATGEAGDNWHIERRKNGWEQIAESSKLPTATVTMDQDTAWKLVTKRRSREAVRQQFPGIEIKGEEAVGRYVLDMVSVMA